MAIRYNDRERIFTLQTKNTTYQMKADHYGTLLHLYYGRRVDDENMDYLIQYADTGFSPNPYDAGTDRTYSLDLLPQEYPSFGVGDYRNTGLHVQHEDGSRAAELRFLSHEIVDTVYGIEGLPAAHTEDGRGQTLVIRLKDVASELVVTLFYGVFEETDMITRSVRLENHGSKQLWVEKIHSACLDLPCGTWDLVHFHGRHNMERMSERVSLGHGTFSIGSRRGTSSHQHNPSAIICSRDAGEDYGICYGMTLLYSGNFSIDTQCDQMNQIRASVGINPEHFRYPLGAGAVFSAPQVLMTCSDQGFAALSHRFHHFIRQHICRGRYQVTRCPVLLNSWEAAYFDFNETKILDLAVQAADLGIEMLVLDDGWFGQRNADNAALGDWYVNEQKLAGGLAPLVSRINEMGLKFGLWVEPEMISEDSDLYREHPDWAISIPGRKPARGRMQLVLDMGRADVRSYLYERLEAILTSAPIEYVKWDFNRSLSDFYSHALPAERQGEGLHRFVLGIYDLLERLTARFPEILFEGCSGGGGRFDAGMLYYTPQIWCSDNTDAIDRLEIQHGTSFFYPVSSVGSHVSACPNHQTGRTVPLHTRSVVAMAGSFGYELDPALLDEAERQQIRTQVKRYIRYQSLIHNGTYYRLESPFDNQKITAWQIVSPEQNETLVSAVITHVRANWPGSRLKLKGLKPDNRYQLIWLDDDCRTPESGGDDSYQPGYSGAALMYGGISIPHVTGDYLAVQFYLRETDLCEAEQIKK